MQKGKIFFSCDSLFLLQEVMDRRRRCYENSVPASIHRKDSNVLNILNYSKCETPTKKILRIL